MNTELQRFDRETRYKVVAHHSVSVQVQSTAGGQTVPLRAELIDISTGGLRICSQTPISENDRLTVTVTTEDAASPATVRAEVCWTSLASKGRFYAGCTIQPTIPQSLLDHLSAAGVLEGRQEVRQETALTVPARWELKPGGGCEAPILNISSDGVSLLMPEPGMVGHRICLTVPDRQQKTTRHYVKARWQISTPEGTVVGCEIADRAVYLQLTQLACAMSN